MDIYGLEAGMKVLLSTYCATQPYIVNIMGWGKFCIPMSFTDGYYCLIYASILLFKTFLRFNFGKLQHLDTIQELKLSPI